MKMRLNLTSWKSNFLQMKFLWVFFLPSSLVFIMPNKLVIFNDEYQYRVQNGQADVVFSKCIASGLNKWHSIF